LGTEQIFALGLHEYLMRVLEKLSALNTEVERHFLVPVYSQLQGQTAAFAAHR
jgi:hypothetical protein